MKSAIIVMLLVSIATTATAGDRWTNTDTAFQVAFTTLNVVDWLQTRQISKHPERWHENNPILGKHPSLLKVDSYFIGSMLINTAIPILLNQPYRRLWQLGSIGIGIKLTTHNTSLGIRIKF